MNTNLILAIVNVVVAVVNLYVAFFNVKNAKYIREYEEEVLHYGDHK